MRSPTSPRTPTHRRHRSSLESLKTSPTTYNNHQYQHQRHDSSQGQGSFSRRSSLTTPRTPITPIGNHHLRSSQSLSNSARMSGGGPINGLGSLADELADAWDEEGEGEGDYETTTMMEEEEEGGEESSWTREKQNDDRSALLYDQMDNSELGFICSPRKKLENKINNNNGGGRWSKHQRKASKSQRSTTLDEDEGEDEANEISSALEARLAEILTLAQRGLKTINSNDLEEEKEKEKEYDNIFDRISAHLQDLGSQTNIETSTTRLINAHNSLTNHLTQQTRHLQTLTYPLFSPITSSFVLSTNPDLIDSSLLDPLLRSLPYREEKENDITAQQPQQQSPAIITLTPLSDLTTDLLQTLTQLSDSLHMTRQTTTMASRRLKTARDMTAEIIRDNVAVEKAIRWIEDCGWEERLAARRCGQTCRDVVSGFEEVCMGWRERIVGWNDTSAAGLVVEMGVSSSTPITTTATAGGEVEVVAS